MADPTGREEYWRRVLETVTPYGLSTVDYSTHFGKFMHFAQFYVVFWRKGVFIVKYILPIHLIFVFIINFTIAVIFVVIVTSLWTEVKRMTLLKVVSTFTKTIFLQWCESGLDVYVCCFASLL